MRNLIGRVTTAFTILLILCYVKSETFIPSTTIPGVMTPGAAAGLTDDRNGFVPLFKKDNVTKWKQNIEGVPVYGSVLTTHGDERGLITKVQGVVSQTASLVDTTPEITSDQALQTLKKHWKHDINESGLRFRIDEPKLQILESGTGWDDLVWLTKYYVEAADLSDVKTAGPTPSYIIGLVHAHNDQVLDTWNNLASVKIKAITGNKKTGKKPQVLEVEQDDDELCRHRDTSRRVEVFDLYNQGNTKHSKVTSQFFCKVADNEEYDLFRWTGGYSPRNDVYLHAIQFVDMWKEFMGDTTQIYKDNSSYLQFYVHYNKYSEDAHFDFDGEIFRFGDGANNFYPLTSLDIVCHEIGHAITQWHGGDLEYRKESGGINEAYSDILGETCDMHYNKKQDFLIGADVIKNGKRAMRDMCNPTAIGKSIDHMDKYRDYMNVHYTSGIYNKAWCALYDMAGWNHRMCFEVFTNANLLYWSEKTSMHCGACGVESAADDLGYSKADVTDAFKVVGVHCSKCTTTKTFFLN